MNINTTREWYVQLIDYYIELLWEHHTAPGVDPMGGGVPEYATVFLRRAQSYAGHTDVTRVWVRVRV